MAEKKFGLGTALLIGAVAAGVAGGVASYIKRAEIKRLAEEIIAKVKPVDYMDDEIGDWDIRPCASQADEPADAPEPNIVDSGISLESVEAPAEDAAEEPAAEPEAETTEEDTSGDAEAEAEAETEEPEEEPKKKTWFWSK